VILRPQISLNGRSNQTIECSRDHATGLLAQAKLGHKRKRRKGYKWDGFTKTQVKLYPSLQKFYSLLLYRLKGEALNELDSVRWQLSHGSSVDEAKVWFKTGIFPEELSSSDVVKMLFDGRIGTRDRDIIQSIIAPSGDDPRVIDIRIF